MKLKKPTFVNFTEFGNLGSVNAGSNTLVTNNYKALNDEGEWEYSGLLQDQTYGNSHKVSYSYDSYDRPSEITYSGGGKTQTYKWDYDSDGRVSRYTENGNANKAFHYTYDLSGRLTQAMRKDGSEYIQPTYDSKNLTTGMKYKFAGSVVSASYSYDESMDNSPSGAAFDGAGKVGYVYDSLGRTKQYGVFNKNNAGVYSASYTYKKNPSDSSKTSGVVEKINYGSINVKALSYVYDKNGNITSINNTDDSVFEKYSYDNLNQLTSALSEQDDYYIKYTYDNAGNILTKKTYSSAYYTSNNESLLESTVNYKYDSTWKDKLISYNGKSISYDAIGNMLSFDSQTFTWLGRRLMSYARGGTTTNYTYNSDGIRTKKVSGSTTTDYCLNGTQILAEKRGGTLINYFYTSDGTRVGFKTGGKVYYYVYNLQGDVTHIVDESKNIVATYRYDPFGKILNLSSLTSIGKLNPFRYRGYYYDTESNLYYLNSRYYNPEIGRFINADAILGANKDILGYNLYAYCSNNPLIYADYYGTFSLQVKFDPSSICGTINDFFGFIVEIGTNDLLQTVAKSAKPANQGYVAFSKQCSDDIELILNSKKTLNMIGDIVGYGLEALDIAINTYNDIKEGKDVQTVIIDFSVDGIIAIVGISLTTVVVPELIPCATAAAGVAVFVSIVYSAVMDSVVIEDRTVREWLKKGANSF